MADKRLMTEFAGFARDVFNMPLAAGILRNLDDVLQTQAGGKGLRIYDELERDAQVFAVVQKRKMAVIQRPWIVEAASDSLRDRKAAELIQQTFESLAFDRLCFDLLDALLKGYAVTEIMWAMQGDLLLPTKFIPRDQRRFVFDADHAPRLLSSSNMMQGEALPDRKFIVHSSGGKDGSPYGLGLGNKLFWPVLFKRQGMAFYLAYADRFGSPTAVGKHPAGAQKPEVDKLLTSLESIAQDTSIAIPDNVLLELLEPKSNTTVYEPLIRYLDDQISVAVLGETMSTTSKAAGLGSSQANVHNEVRTELAEADADLLSDTLNATVVRWIVELNLANANPPRVWRDFSTPEDLKARAERDQIVATMSGLRPTAKYVQETYGGEWEAVAPPPPPAPGKDAPAPAAALTATLPGTPEGDALDALVTEALSGWEADMAPVKQTIQKVLDEAQAAGETAEQVLARLAAMLKVGGPMSLDGKLTQAAFIAHLAGEAGIEVVQDGR